MSAAQARLATKSAVEAKSKRTSYSILGVLALIPAAAMNAITRPFTDRVNAKRMTDEELIERIFWENADERYNTAYHHESDRRKIDVQAELVPK